MRLKSSGIGHIATMDYVLVVADDNKVIVNFRPNHWVKLQEMCENYFLKGKNGQFYSIK